MQKLGLWLIVGCMLLWAWPLVAVGSESRVINMTTPGCDSKDTYHQAVRILVAQDWEAFARLMLAGRCTSLKQGQQVYLEDVTWTGLSQVRIRGKTQRWWTSTEFVGK